MKNLILRALFLAVVIFIPFSSLAVSPHKRTALNESIVSVNNACSGYIAAPDIVVTAAHCLPSSKTTATVYFSDHSYGRFAVLYYGKEGSESDFAILKGETGQREELLRATFKAKPNDRVVHYRYIESEVAQYLTPGLLAGMQCEPEIGCMLQVIYQVEAGDSGGPVIHYPSGKVVGVISMGYFPIGVPLGLAVPHEKIYEKLDELTKVMTKPTAPPAKSSEADKPAA